MPIFTYLSVVGAALLALLFFADANLQKPEQLANSSNFEGLPKPWRPELNPPLPPTKPQQIQTAAAPALDPSYQANKPAEVAAVSPAPAEAPVKRIAKSEPAPKKQRHAAHRAPRRNNEYSQRYAWRHDGGGFFGGGGGGTPWRF